MQLVKITIDDDGVKKKHARWCLGADFTDCWRSVCTGEAYGMGDSGAVFTTKRLTEGKVTCPECIAIIKQFKAVKL